MHQTISFYKGLVWSGLVNDFWLFKYFLLIHFKFSAKYQKHFHGTPVASNFVSHLVQAVKCGANGIMIQKRQKVTSSYSLRKRKTLLPELKVSLGGNSERNNSALLDSRYKCTRLKYQH